MWAYTHIMGAVCHSVLFTLYSIALFLLSPTLNWRMSSSVTCTTSVIFVTLSAFPTGQSKTRYEPYEIVVVADCLIACAVTDQAVEGCFGRVEKRSEQESCNDVCWRGLWDTRTTDWQWRVRIEPANVFLCLVALCICCQPPSCSFFHLPIDQLIPIHSSFNPLICPLTHLLQPSLENFYPSSIHPSVHPYVYPSSHLSTHPSSQPSFHHAMNPFTCPSFHLPIHPPMYPFIHLARVLMPGQPQWLEQDTSHLAFTFRPHRKLLRLG